MAIRIKAGDNMKDGGVLLHATKCRLAHGGDSAIRPKRYALQPASARCAKCLPQDKEAGGKAKMEAEEKWETLKFWLETDKSNGQGHKANRALYLMRELDEKSPPAKDKEGQALRTTRSMASALANAVQDWEENIDYEFSTPQLTDLLERLNIALQPYMRLVAQ